jgi:general secretion pathway protein A
MYEAFYGLKERPFNLTPDPKYLYLSDKHKEAFAHLLFGIKNRSGFVMVTGEIGTGKTTICRNLINQLNQDVNLALIFNPSLNPVELMQKINAEFGIAHDATNVRELVDQLNVYLLEQATHDRTCVLIIDEAQNLAPSVLEQIRLLSNLETETEKLLQIILIGQPELAEKLALHELRQLNQRITARYHLKPLDQKETHQYIQYRLHVTGGRRKLKFTPAAVRTIFGHSKGTPRVINAVSDRCLLIGYTKETHIITPRIARQSIRELRGSYRDTAKDVKRWLYSLLPSPSSVVFAALILIALGGAGLFFSQPISQLAQELGAFNKILAGGKPPVSAPDANAPAPAPEVQPSSNVVEVPTDPVVPASPVISSVIETITRNNTPPPGPPPLAERVSQLAAPAALEAGAAALLAAWNAPLEGAYPATADPAVVRDFAQRHGLSSESLKPALDQLLAINLPALVRVGASGEGRWMALIGASGDKLTLTGAMGESIETTREAFATMYAKEAYILWRDNGPKKSGLLPGRSGKNVAEFKDKLRSLGRISADNTTDMYDVETGTAVSRIQAETGLLLDGLAGQQVRMVMSSWTGGDETPKLDATLKVAVATPATPVAVPPAPEPERKAEPKPEPKPEPTPAPVEVPAQPVPAPEVVPAPVNSPEPAPQPDAAVEQPPVETPAQQDPAALVQVQELSEPVEGSFVPEVDDARKETTPPMNGSAPLVPAE